MSDELLIWLNNDINLSKKITDIPKDFSTGYYFAELLNKTNHLPVLSSYKNTTNQKDIIQNLHQLQINLDEIGIILNEQCKKKIMNADIYTSKIYLYKIKKLLESKNINLKLLHFKNSISLSKMFNSIYFKNDNEKYLRNINKKSIYNSGIDHYKYYKKYDENKYKIGGELYKDIKKEFSHLELNDFDMKMILADIKESEFKINYLKNYVYKSEEKQKNINKLKEEKEIQLWNKNLTKINKIKKGIIDKSWNKVKRNMNLFNNHMKGNSVNLQKNTLDFDDNLNLYQKTTNNYNENEEYEMDEEELEEKNKRDFKISQVALSNIRKKLEDNLKNKKNKEKRERQKLKEENITLENLHLNKNKKNYLKEVKYTTIDIRKDNIENEDDKETLRKTESKEGSKNSTYSRLTKGDYCANLIKNSFSIHKPSIKIGNRINFFKTIISSNIKPEKLLPDIKLKKTEDNKTKNSEGFNEEEFFNSLNQQNYETQKKTTEKKKAKNKMKKNLIRPIVDQILEITNNIYNYKNENDVKLVNDNIWKDLTDKLINNELLNESDDDILIIKQEEKNNKKEENDNNENENNAETENESQFHKTKYIDISNLYEDLFNDYLNYTGLFNDIIIPHEIRGKKYSYIELYSELYDFFKNKVDIKDYEPIPEEIDNLYLPKYSLGPNTYFYDILTEIIEFQNNSKNNIGDGNIINLKNDLKKINNDNYQDNSFKITIKKKGKYYYLPIKMAFVGYPLSGKRTQSQLLQSIYPNIKIYDPENLLKEKLNEYKELYENLENNPKIKTMKPNQLEQYKKEIEEKKNNFKPIFDIIKPYVDFIQKKKEIENILDEKDKNINENKKNKKEEENKNNNKDKKSNLSKNQSKENVNKSKNSINLSKKEEENEEEILSDIYMKLFLYEIKKDYNENEEDILNRIISNKNKYSNYNKTLEKIKEIKEKIEETSKEQKDMQEKKPNKKEINNAQNNLIKELETLNKDLISIKSSLYSGFILINYPKTEKDALKLEKYFTGFQLDYQKPRNITEEKLSSYNILNFNLEKKFMNKNNPLVSFLDLYINFEIDSKEVEKRYNDTKYDKTTGKKYTKDEIATINDKKLLERLEKGMPGITEKEIEIMKSNYEDNIIEISKLYKKINNGIKSIYINMEQNDVEKKYLKEINPVLDSSMEEIIFKYYYKNIDELINIVNENIKNKENEEKEKLPDNNEIKNMEEKKDLINKESKDTNYEKINNPINNVVSKNTYTIYKEIISDLDTFYPNYKLSIKSIIYFMSKQRKDIIKYLNKIQNTFVEFLNRKSENNDIIEMYIQKYNNLFKMHPELKKNKTVYDELMNDIGNVNNSIWIRIQTKKKENIKYLDDIKTNGEKEKKISKFIEHSLKIIEIEIEKYLIKCEIILKYYLNRVGLLSDIMGIFQHSNDQYMFKIEYQKYLYNNFNIINYNSDYLNRPELLNTLSTNETQFPFNKNNSSSDNNKFDKYIEKELNILFENSLKIIIRQDRLNLKYVEKIKSFFNKGEKNYKNSISKEISSKNKKVSISSFSVPGNNSAITSKSSNAKKKLKNLANTSPNNTEANLSEETLRNQLIEEKNNLKYRLMFLQNFFLRYIKTIDDCYNTIFNNMDEWIIMNMEVQNNKLNEFINYLKRALNKNIEEISMKGREFDYNDKYNKNKKLVLPIYKNLYPDKIFNLNIPFSKGDNFEKNLVKLNDLNDIQQYVYNINDLMILYKYIKEFSLQTCEYFVKYEIVKEILMNYLINQKEYYLFYNDIPKLKINNKVNCNNSNGICKKMKFYSYEKIDNLIKIFFVYNNRYININELFTTLIIIGSELINSEKFEEIIKESIPENKKNQKNILLTLDEFMKIQFWFENDRYLNELSDYSEENIFIGEYSNNYSINQINQNKKTKKNSEKFENESRTSSKKETIKKVKKINKIKESIFEINMENNLIDINLLKELLDKLNNYCNNKNKNISFNINKEDFDNVDIEDKCYRFSSDDVDDYFDMDKNSEIMHKSTHSNLKNIKSHIHIMNNIFNCIFEK